MRILWLIALLGIYCVIFTSCAGSKSKSVSKPMQSSYEDLWKKVELKDHEGLPQSALTIVDSIALIAKQEGNSIQQIKTLIYRAKYGSQLDEAGLKKGIELFVADLKSSSDPVVQAMMHSLLAQLYQKYFEMNMWVIQDRTTVVDVQESNVENWSTNDFLKNIRKHYLASITSPILKTIPIQEYSVLLTEGKGADSLRPFLFDILAHRALDYFMNSRSDLDLVDDDMVLDHPLLFAHSDQFISFKQGGISDSNSFYRTIISTFQELESFHRKDILPTAWLDVVQKRLQFVYNHYSGSEKIGLYEASLGQWINSFASKQESAQFLLLQAYLYKELGHQYQAMSTDTMYRGYLVKSKKILESILNDFKGTKDANQAFNTLNELKQSTLEGQTEKVNPIASPFRMLVTYRNVQNIYVKVIPIDLDLRQKINQLPIENTLSQILHVKPAQTFSQSLPASDDLQQHRAELKVDGLPSGMYAILLSNTEKFNLGEDVLALMYTHISNLAYLHSFNQYYYSNVERLNQVKELFVVDRKAGTPIPDVQANFYENQYNQTVQRYHWIKINDKNSDYNGRIVPNLPLHRNFSVQLIKGSDYLWLEDGFSNATYNQENLKENPDLLFFLDRSLYRPGQIIYFKGLALARDVAGNPRILKNRKVGINLTDANGQIVTSKTFTSNDFGTFNGSFTAPLQGLMGSMSLVSDMNSASVQFQVEEYKRPKFEVLFDTNKVVSRLNEAVTITGHAKNYAGNVVDQAMVSYKVSRMRYRRPMPWWGWKSYFPVYSEPRIIAHGETNTDATGKFLIPFTALPEPNIDLTKEDISFIYTIEVDITDFTGETRSASTEIRIGNRNLVLSTSLNQSEIKDSLQEIKISATDLNGTKLESSGTISIYRLKEPELHFRERYWEQPDQQVIIESDYRNWFPTDIYKDEHAVANWPITQTLLSSMFDSRYAFKLNQKLETGIYKLVATSKDKQQQITTYEHYFWVTDPRRGIFESNIPLAYFQSTSVLQPDQTLTYIVRSKSIPHHILQYSTVSNQSQWLVNAGLLQDKIILSEKERGKMHQHTWYMIHDNRIYSKQMNYGITWDNKDLQIQTVSFRDKLLPGQNEEWILKISGHEKDKFITELVASMYDQSLDAIYPHAWRRDLFRMSYLPPANYLAVGFNAIGSNYFNRHQLPYKEIDQILYRDLHWYGFDIYGGRMYHSEGGMKYKVEERMQSDAMVLSKPGAPPAQAASRNQNKDEDYKQPPAEAPKKETTPPIRKNLKETVFFYPDLKTDSEGNVLLKFKMNEALTRWRLMLFGHTQDLQSGYMEKEIITQKELMVFPNAPRFVRQGDRLEFPAKVSNLGSQFISGNARLELFDPISEQSLNHIFNVRSIKSDFTIQSGQSNSLSWTLNVPQDYIGMVGYRVIAESGSIVDGEENVLPVLSNRMLVTETMPFQVKANQSKSFVFNELKTKSSSPTLKHHALTLECTANPVWYAIQALPYMMEYPHECTEQMVNRLYANILAATIIKENPSIKNIFDAWSKSGELKSPLSKNEDLKTAILSETPWVKEALSEAEQQKMIALLFDLNKIAAEKDHVAQVLIQRQLSNGGFPWFEGRDDWYITQYIIESMGHLKKLGVLPEELNEVVKKAVGYCDRELIKFYEDLKKNSKKEDIGLPEIAIHYLYARSFFSFIKIENKTAFNYFVLEAEKVWLKQSLYSQGMIALALDRWQPDSKVPVKILASLLERAQHHEELGMYWKFEHGYRWFELPIETQALLIEAFTELKPAMTQEVDNMRIWLLKNKQTNHWASTKSTAAAIYALLLQSKSWISESKLPDLKWGSDKVTVTKDQVVPGLGYFKLKKEASAVYVDLCNLSVTNPNNHIMWGAAYWQYFEDLDKITFFKTTPIAIKKQLLLEIIDGNKRNLKPFTSLNVGEKIIVRIEIKVDRPMDYVHLKDMRAAGLEPIHAISQYKYQGGLGYYESTKDVATHFFFDRLYPGTFVLEYPLRVTQQGEFSNGISTMECMYAPEYSTHSKGDLVRIE